MRLSAFELARAERVAFSAQVDVWADKYASTVSGTGERSAYVKLVVRLMTTRCCMNGIVEHSNIEKVMDKLFQGDLSTISYARLLQIVQNPLTTEDTKMAEISKQFYGEKPTASPGFAMWKMP
jgi:hypothetical protein